MEKAGKQTPTPKSEQFAKEESLSDEMASFYEAMEVGFCLNSFHSALFICYYDYLLTKRQAGCSYIVTITFGLKNKQYVYTVFFVNKYLPVLENVCRY